MKLVGEASRPITVGVQPWENQVLQSKSTLDCRRELKSSMSSDAVAVACASGSRNPVNGAGYAMPADDCASG